MVVFCVDYPLNVGGPWWCILTNEIFYRNVVDLLEELEWALEKLVGYSYRWSGFYDQVEIRTNKQISCKWRNTY